MSISQQPVEAPAAPAVENDQEVKESKVNGIPKAPSPAPKASQDTTSALASNSMDPTAEFSGDIMTDNSIPTQKTIRKVADLPVLDKDGKSIPFKSLYSGPMVARRVLVIFVRHFFCGVSTILPNSQNELFQDEHINSP
jgi:hypothetical protein